jgi:hypothetical protein
MTVRALPLGGVPVVVLWGCSGGSCRGSYSQATPSLSRSSFVE